MLLLQVSDIGLEADQAERQLAEEKEAFRRCIETRRLPTHRVGRLWKFKVSEVDASVEPCGGGKEACDGGQQTKRGCT